LDKWTHEGPCCQNGHGIGIAWPPAATGRIGPRRDVPERIYVLAGTNGAGKSSVAGAMFRQAGADCLNRDEATARILAANPGSTAAEANSAAGHEGKRLLERDRGASGSWD
jgi:hypothetical protein